MIKRTHYLRPVTRMSLAFFVMFLPFNAGSTYGENRSVLPSSSASEELLQLSGMGEQLQALPAAIMASFEQSLQSGGLALPFLESDGLELKQALNRVFRSESLQLAVRRQLDADLDDEQLASLVRFYRSGHGQDISRAETGNSILRNRERFDNWYASYGMRSLNATRQRIIRELERALQATDAAVDTVISMQVALQVGLTPALPAEQQQSVAQLISHASAQRPVLTRAYHNSSLQTLAYLFHQLPDETLTTFTTTLNTPAGQRYVRAVNLGLSHGMLDAAEALGAEMKPLLLRRLGRGA